MQCLASCVSIMHVEHRLPGQYSVDCCHVVGAWTLLIESHIFIQWLFARFGNNNNNNNSNSNACIAADNPIMNSSEQWTALSIGYHSILFVYLWLSLAQDTKQKRKEKELHLLIWFYWTTVSTMLLLLSLNFILFVRGPESEDPFPL